MGPNTSRSRDLRLATSNRERREEAPDCGGTRGSFTRWCQRASGGDLRGVLFEHLQRLPVDHRARHPSTAAPDRRYAALPCSRRADRERAERSPAEAAARASAEQRWPALLKPDATASSTTCSASAELSTIIALRPPVSAMSVAMLPFRAARLRSISRAVSVEPVNATPAMRLIPRQRGTDRATVARQELQHLNGHARRSASTESPAPR